ncbi:MAG: BspA family leucine-rich repeat surface protein [Prevotella sp.]|nr:BspA family leucine-rich repeat surface protein [Prevotella sp.]
MKTKLLLFVTTLLMTTMGVKADDAFVVWDATSTTLYFSYGAIPTEDGSWTNEAGNSVTVTKVWSGTAVTNSPNNNAPAWYVQGAWDAATKVVFESSFSSVKPTSFYGWFLSYSEITTIEGLENLDTSEATTMRFMFSNNSALSALDLSNFDTSKVTDMSEMFVGCANLKTIIVGDKWDTSSVTESGYMFYDSNGIVGEDGTVSSTGAATANKAQAHTGAGGYLTKKTVSIAANTVGSDNWATYYKSNVNRVADANTTVYIATVAGDKLTLTAVADKNIKAGQAVILKSTAANVTLTSTTDEATADFSANELIGTDVAMAAPANTYVLGNGTKGIGFYQFTGTTLSANKAYITVSAGAREFFDFDNVTGIKTVRNNSLENAVYYNLQGHRVLNPTKGLYILNGKKVVIK